MDKEEDNKIKSNEQQLNEEKKDDLPEKSINNKEKSAVLTDMKPGDGANGHAAPAVNGQMVDIPLTEDVTNEEDAGEDEVKKAEDAPQVGVISLFRFASKLDLVFMFLGTIGAMANGAALPLVLVLFGDVIDSFITAGSAQVMMNGTTASMIPPINESLGLIADSAKSYAYLGCGVLLVSFLQSGLWSLAAERQVRVIRIRYFRAMLGQDIAWFDENKSGELTTRITE